MDAANYNGEAVVNHERYREHRIPTSLDRHVGRAPMDDAELKRLARAAWLQRGVVILMPDQLLNWHERGLIEAAAIKLYGKRTMEKR